MSSNWRPDDSLFKSGPGGEMPGARRVREAQRAHGIQLGDRVVTSKDPDIQAAQQDLKRDPGLPGVEQWLMPLVFRQEGEVVWLMSRMEPGAEVPEHQHDNAHLRIVVQGSAEYGDVRLEPGDWMAVPAGVSYALKAGPEGCIFWYPHPFPWWP